MSPIMGLSSIALFIGFAHATNDTVVKGWVPEPNGRGTWSILWSSLVTVFICTWSVLHLSVQKQGRWRSFLRKCIWMLSAVLAPEYILSISVEGFLNSRKYLPALVQYGGSEWTMTHAQFAWDYGFEITYGDGRSKVIKSGEMIERMAKGEISQPPISAEELQSRGDSNWLVKLIALLQIVWFALQTLFRAVQHIQVTPLELMVIAFVFCSIITYLFDWSKPQNVEYTISIPLKSNPPGDTRATLTKSQEEMQDQQRSTKLTSSANHVQKFDSTEADVRTPSDGIDDVERDSSGSSRQSMELPQELKMRYPMMVVLVSMTVFGAVHCLAWNSPFPSSAEQLTWRICALITTSLPALTGGVVVGLPSDDVEKYLDRGIDWDIENFMPISTIVLYAVPRLILIVLAFTALRAQPSDAYQTVNWTQYLPNFAA